MNRIFTLFFGLLLTTLAFGQKMKLDYDNDSRWFWGVNVGTTWSTADVAKKHDWGWGVTLGKSFNYGIGKPVSFDLRARFLTGEWYGQGTGLTSGIDTAANPLYAPYAQSGRSAVLNHYTRANELSLELVLHANNLRANTGWDPYIFGGIGYTWSKTKLDLYNNGVLYNYDSLASTGGLSKTNLASYMDGSYETNHNGDKFSGAFMPSAGVGLGYQFGPRFSMGIEHKTTFTLADNFDGYSAKGKYNDWYHYTSVYMRFQIRDHRRIVEEDNSLENVNNYNNGTATTNTPPIVDFLNPNVSGITVSSPSYTIRGKIQHVVSSNNVIFKQNGNYVSNFVFNPSNQTFECVVTLNPGQNVFELIGTNDFGSDQETTIINYELNQNRPPVVTYQNPAASPTTVQNPTFALSATVLNVSQQNQITMTNNGQNVNFVFNPANGSTTASLNLVVGTNIVTTTGTNPYGSDQESVTIIYQPIQTVQPPVVYFVDPNVSPYTTTNATFTINANVLNVDGAQNITFKQNGTINQNFVYNAQTHGFQSNVVLNAGQNVFEIIGTNSAGSAQASTIIIYNRAAPKPPIVTITNPNVNPYESNNSNFNLGATVLNVTQANQITVKLNNQTVAFNYSNTNNSVTASLNLQLGANTVIVTGTNPDGSDAKQTTIIYRQVQQVLPPEVQFTNPSTDPFTINQAAFTVVASVTNVSAISGVNVNVNGQNITNFTFANGVVTLPLTLIEGANVITITGTNTAGTDSETQTIIYRKPTVVQPPVVTFVNPTTNPITVFNPTYAVQALVKYVAGASNITLRINGQLSTNFTYSASSEMMDFTTALVQGANVVEITGTNTAGQDQASTTIIYRINNPTVPPVVTITNPSANTTTVSTNTYPISATVLNVDGQQNIQVLVNGVSISNFTYDPTTKQVNFLMNLNAGSNTVMITGTNSAGQAFDTKTIVYSRQETVLLPVASFINPAVSGTTVNTAAIIVKAKVLNVNTASQIVFLQDGQAVNPTFWNFNITTKEVTFATNLNSGNNIFTVTGTNSAGSHTATTTINYQIPVVVCDKPVITITAPSTSGITEDEALFNVMATVTNITSANQVQILVNGIPQSAGNYNAATKVFSKQITLVEGQNALTLVATNNCGEASASTVILYKKPSAPCVPASVSRVDPVQDLVNTENATISIKAAVANVSTASEIQVTVNGTAINFNYDAAAHLVNAMVNLVEGENLIQITVTNACGTDFIKWNVKRKVCLAPTIQMTSTSVPLNTTTFNDNLSYVAAVTGITSSAQITVTYNGQNVGFVFNEQTGILTVNQALSIGANSFTIKVQNECGSDTEKFALTRRQEVVVNPPTITITNPANSPYQINQNGMTVNALTTNVTSMNQISVTVNGASINFNFDPTTGAINFNANFQPGANLIVANVVNTAGSATDSKTVIYTEPVVVQPPVITFTNPTSCPAVFPRGVQTITGTVTNVTNASQVVILYDGSNVTFNSTISNNVLTFSFQVNVNNTLVDVSMLVTATNEGGSDMESCIITKLRSDRTEGGNGNNGHGNNTDGNDESNPGNGQGGPNGETGGSVDDENGNGNGNGNGGNGSGNKAGGKGTTVVKPTTTKPTTTRPTPTVKPTPTRP